MDSAFGCSFRLICIVSTLSDAFSLTVKLQLCCVNAVRCLLIVYEATAVLCERCQMPSHCLWSYSCIVSVLSDAFSLSVKPQLYCVNAVRCLLIVCEATAVLCQCCQMPSHCLWSYSCIVSMLSDAFSLSVKPQLYCVNAVRCLLIVCEATAVLCQCCQMPSHCLWSHSCIVSMLSDAFSLSVKPQLYCVNAVRIVCEATAVLCRRRQMPSHCLWSYSCIVSTLSGAFSLSVKLQLYCVNAVRCLLIVYEAREEGEFRSSHFSTKMRRIYIWLTHDLLLYKTCRLVAGPWIDCLSVRPAELRWELLSAQIKAWSLVSH